MNIKSFAKINLGLYITGKRPDGFHELYSIFQEIDLFDEINIKIYKNGQKNIEIIAPEGIPCDKRNTVFRAIKIFQEKISDSFKIRLIKNIPPEAGLGGGSANAAYVLKELNKHYQLFSNNELLEKSAEIGSDLPFFIHGNQALVTGRGEFVKPVYFSFPYHIVLMKPLNHAFSTKEIYLEYARFLGDKVEKENIDNFLENSSLENLKKIENHLEKPLKKYSIIEKLKNFLYENGAEYSAMTGSGSVVFGIFKEKPLLPLQKDYKILYTKAKIS
jgi:4-diphosphocytidyl-2-C-methyl-D-erythritol kinase